MQSARDYYILTEMTWFFLNRMFLQCIRNEGNFSKRTTI